MNAGPTGRIVHSSRAASSPRSRTAPDALARSGTLDVHACPPTARQRACIVTRSCARRPRTSIATGVSARSGDLIASDTRLPLLPLLP